MLTRLLLHSSLKILLFAWLETGHFQVAKVGSIQHANQHLVADTMISAKLLNDTLLNSQHFINRKKLNRAIWHGACWAMRLSNFGIKYVAVALTAYALAAIAIGFADKSSYAAQLDADPNLSSRLADCYDWKVALSSYEANKQRFDTASAESVSNQSIEIRSIRFFNSLVPVPVSVLDRYEVSSNLDFGRISLTAKDGMKLVVSADRSRKKLDSMRTPGPLLARNPDAGPTIFQSMFRFDAEDLTCKDTTYSFDRSLLKVLREKQAAASSGGGYPVVAIYEISGFGREGSLTHRYNSESGDEVWWAEYVENDVHFTWALRRSASSAAGSDLTALFLLGELSPAHQKLVGDSEFKKHLAKAEKAMEAFSVNGVFSE